LIACCFCPVCWQRQYPEHLRRRKLPGYSPPDARAVADAHSRWFRRQRLKLRCAPLPLRAGARRLLPPAAAAPRRLRPLHAAARPLPPAAAPSPPHAAPRPVAAPPLLRPGVAWRPTLPVRAPLPPPCVAHPSATGRTRSVPCG